MQVIKLNEFKNRGTIDLLEKLLQEARNGEIRGFLFCSRRDAKTYAVGASGDFQEDPLIAVAATARMAHMFNVMVDGRESLTKNNYSGTGF